MNRDSYINYYTKLVMKKVEIDKMIDKISFLGVPGLVFLVLLSFSPWAGGAAIMSTLSLLGGPFGAIAGIGVLLVFSKYGSKISALGYNKVISLVIHRMRSKGKTEEEIVEEIKSFPITDELKRKVINKMQIAVESDQKEDDQYSSITPRR